LIIELGEWVLHQACRYAMSWPEPLQVSVNISTVQFKARNLVAAVTEALRVSGLDPARIACNHSLCLDLRIGPLFASI
jgi:EAL domain-containing protein (putative c-di-GMP-specific phosphodiesterase class I)